MYAGFWRRFFAFIIDVIIIYVILGLVIGALALGGFFADISFENLTEKTNSMAPLFYLFIFGLTIFYWTLFECSSAQATPGKMALGIKVTDEYGQRLTFVKSLSRNLGKIVSKFTLNVGYAMAGFTVRRQALHDKITNCLVIHKNADINNLQPLPKSSPWLIILAIIGIFMPGIIFFAFIVAIASWAVYMGLPYMEAKAEISNLEAIAEAQNIYLSKNGVYSNSFYDLFTYTASIDSDIVERPYVRTDVSLNENNFSYNFVNSGISASSKKRPFYTITVCYQDNKTCLNKEVKQLSALKLTIAAPQECCKGSVPATGLTGGY